jgi:PGF-CTERM protein
VDGSRVTYKSVNDLSTGASGATAFTWSAGRDVSGGDHSVSAYVDMRDKDGYYAQITESDESNNEKEDDLTIAKIYTYAELTVTVKDSRNSNPLKRAEVYIDDDLLGRTDSDGKITEKVVEGEKHIIKVVKSDYYSKIKTVDVGYDVGAKEVTIRLDYAKVPITIYVEDENRDAVSNAEVFLDSISIGITDIEGEVTGDATKNNDIMIKVVKSGYYSEDALIHVGSYKERFSIKLKCEDKTAPNILVEKIERVGDNDDILEVGECLKITYSVRDNSGIKDIKCKLDGNLIDSYTTAGTYSTTTPQLTIGTHVIELEAIDADINPHKSVKAVSITVSAKGPTVHFKSTKLTINKGENAVFTLGALNPIGRKNMTVELILKTPSGVSVSGISFVKSGGGMYQATYEIEPGEGMKLITVNLIGNELGSHKIEAEVHYTVPDGEVKTQHEMLTLTVIDESVKKKEKGTTPEQGPSGSTTPGFEAILAIAALLAIAYLGRGRR